MISWVRALVWVTPQATCRTTGAVRQEREQHRVGVALLHLDAVPVDAAPVEARRRAGLEPAQRQRRAPSRRSASRTDGGVARSARPEAWSRRCGSRRSGRCRWSGPPRRAETSAPSREHDAGDAAALDEQVDDLALDDRRGRAARRTPPAPPRGRARGRPGRADPDRRALGAVEQAELDAGAVGRAAHEPVSASISRTRWPLPSPPMAGLQDISPSRSSRCVSSAVRAPIRRAASGGLGAGVAAADHDDVEVAMFHVKHPHLPMQKLEKISPRISSTSTRPTRASSARSAAAQVFGHQLRRRLRRPSSCRRRPRRAAAARSIACALALVRRQPPPATPRLAARRRSVSSSASIPRPVMPGDRQSRPPARRSALACTTRSPARAPRRGPSTSRRRCRRGTPAGPPLARPRARALDPDGLDLVARPRAARQCRGASPAGRRGPSAPRSRRAWCRRPPR